VDTRVDNLRLTIEFSRDSFTTRPKSTTRAPLLGNYPQLVNTCACASRRADLWLSPASTSP